VLVSVLGAVGIGLTATPTVPYIELVLCCIPFVCAYVDALTYHQGLLINSIGTFIRSRETSTDTQELVFAAYESFSLKVRTLKDARGKLYDATDFERLVVYWSSVSFSIAITLYAIIHWFPRHQKRAWIICMSGLLGLIVTIYLKHRYERIRSLIREISTESIEKSKG
jgi:hypothetical protein